MEMRVGYGVSLVVQRVCRWVAMMLLLLPMAANAQHTKPGYVIDDGRMVITLDLHIADSVLHNFIFKYNLDDLDLTDFVKKHLTDSLRIKGWNIDQKSNGLVIISKPLNAMKSDEGENRERPEAPERPEAKEKPELVELMQMLISIDDKESGQPANGSNESGANHFKNKHPFYVSDSVVTFFLRAHFNAHAVFLAGSFTDWESGKLPMLKTDSGWIANVKLAPGKYFYKFITDGNWITDGDNTIKEHDGNGNENSVYYKANKVFILKGHQDARKVVLAGSFNKWLPDDIQMEPAAAVWEAALYLSPGTYTYRFVVDGKWMADPDNDLKLLNEFNSYNSMVEIGEPYIFRLQGYTDAKAVTVAGSFNQWQGDQLYMFKTATGWELPYTLGPGNYEYKFVVDGNWISDPANPLKVIDGNSYFIREPNYTFHLKGFDGAKAVYLAGDFDDWCSNTLLMTHTGDEWTYSVYLSPGKHLYKYVVDGKWIRDPDNPLWEDENNSIIWEKK